MNKMKFETIPEYIYIKYEKALLEGDKFLCFSTVDSLLSSDAPLKDVYIGIFQRSMYNVGRLWQNNEISVSVEHIASGITSDLITLCYGRAAFSDRKDKKAVISCVTNEMHQIGSRMVADYIESNGWDTHFVGSDMPADHLADFVRNERPDLVGLSLTMFFNIGLLVSMIKRLRERKFQGPILVGGQGFSWGGIEHIKDMKDVFYVNSLDGLEQYL